MRESVLAYYASPLLVEFALGLIIYKYMGWWIRMGWAWVCGLLLCVVFVLILAPAGVAAAESSWSRVFYYGIPSTVLFMVVVAAERNGGRFGGALIQIMGDSSYSLYLVHGFVIPAALIVFIKFGMRDWPWVVGLLVVALCAIAGVCSYFIIEKPIVNFLGRATVAPRKL
jgi:peptidoglycan/LPS O-acetylase OafA/YrhL